MAQRGLSLRSLVAVVCACVTTGVLIHPVEAYAPRLVTLEYRLGEGAGDCPSRQALHHAVAARLGYMPFVTESAERVMVAIEARGSDYRAEIRLEHASRGTSAERQVEATVQGCDELIAALALSVSIALDPDAVERVKRPRRERDLDGRRRQRRVAEPLRSDALPAGRDESVSLRAPLAPGRWRVGGRVGVVWGATPVVAPELTIQATYDATLWAVGAELRGALPVPKSIMGGDIHGTRVVAGTHLCAGPHWLRACGVVSAGALMLTSEGLVDGRTEHLFVASAGARVDLMWPLNHGLSLGGGVGVDVPLVQVDALVGEDVVWRTGPVGVEASAGLSWRL